MKTLGGIAWLGLAVGCAPAPEPVPPVPSETGRAPHTGASGHTSAPDTSTPATADTAAAPHTGDTAALEGTADTGAPPLDCARIPGPPLATTRLTGPPASEDFAFDGAKMISHYGTWLVKSDHPPGAADPWVPTQGGPGGPASMRMLSTGDLVYHDVDTSALYRVEPSGGVTVVYSGFGYAGGIEVHPTDLVYVVDLAGIHLVEPYTQAHALVLTSEPWSGPNGITLSSDHTTLFVSARNGIWALPVGPDGAPTGRSIQWAPPPPGAIELLGMGVDACNNLYVAGSAAFASTVWRYPAGGAEPVVLLERPGGWLSNLQWGSGVGGWDAQKLYVVDRSTASPGFDELDVQVPEKPR